MKLYPNKRSSQEQVNPVSIKKSRSWGKYVYLLIVFMGFAGLGKWGLTHFYYTKSPGILAGVEAKVEAPINAIVKSLPLTIGDTVKKDAPLVVLYDIQLQEKIAQQEGEVKRLQAEEQREKRQLDILINEQKAQLALAKSQAQGKKEDLIGQIEVFGLKEKNTRERIKQMRELFQQTKRLYQLDATPQPRFLEIKLLLEDSEAKLETIGAELKAARRKLVYLEEEIQMQEKISLELPKTIRTKSSLPILVVQIKSAQEQLTLFKQSLQEQTLRSPLSGVVNQVFKKPGEVVIPGEPILSIIDPKSIFVKAYFPQEEEASLQLKERVELLFDNGHQSQGIISKFYPATGPLPPQFQERYKPRQQALIAEINSTKGSTWPLTLGMGVRVQRNRF